MTITVGVFGATGYTGLELIGILENHPGVEIIFATSESSAGKSLCELSPRAPDSCLIPSAEAPFDEIDCAFLCLPHTQSAPIAAKALAQGVKVIDLSADLRLDDPAVYEQWYKVAHPNPDLLPVPYGIPELAEREKLAGASCIANPGCYATAALLGIIPLANAGLFLPGTPIIVDAKSGVSGAGKTPKTHTLFCEVHGNFYPYAIGRAHRHISEIEQEMVKTGLEAGRLIFSPHLLPTDRGIIATLYAQVSDMEAALEAFAGQYTGEPLVHLLPEGQLASLVHVTRTPLAVISLTPVTGSLLIVSVAIDNLLKGASSQAVQNFNLMFGLDETMGLLPIQGGIA